jgi:hypothetical protein
MGWYQSKNHGEVLISKEILLKKGQFYQIEITGSEEFDLYGKVNLTIR